MEYFPPPFCTRVFHYANFFLWVSPILLKSSHGFMMEGADINRVFMTVRKKAYSVFQFVGLLEMRDKKYSTFFLDHHTTF